jgi:peroxiredoxin-like protein
MNSTHYYEVNVDWKELKLGNLASPHLDSTIEVATPPEFEGGIAGVWSPEHLLVAAVNSCLMTTFLAIAQNSKLAFTKFKCNAKGKLEKIEGKYLISEITLLPIVHVVNEADKERAERVLVKAEANCLITNSIKATIVFMPTVLID